MSNADVKRLLRKSKLSGKEAALLIIRDGWQDMATGKGFLSEAEKAAIRDNIRPGQHEIFNEYIQFNEAALYGVLDAGRLGLSIAMECGRLAPIVISYGTEARHRGVISRLPHVVTAKEYEERRRAQREYDLLAPVSLGHVLYWYLPQDELASEELLQEADAFEKRERPEDDETYYDGLLEYVLDEGKEPEMGRPWLEWLLEMLKGGRLEPVYYTDEASGRAHGFLETSADYASIYEEQSQRPGARDTAALIDAIERYLAGELEGAELNTRLWETFVSGPELYEAGLAKYQEHIDNYEARLPEWPILAILQDEGSYESARLIDRDTGHYRSERVERELGYVSLYASHQKVYAETHEGGLEGYLTRRREYLISRMEELIAFKLGLQAASRVLGVELTKEPWDEMDEGYEGIRQLNTLIDIARRDDLSMADIEPKLPIEQIDTSSLRPSQKVIELINSRLGKLLPAGWAEEEIGLGPEPEDEEEAHEQA